MKFLFACTRHEHYNWQCLHSIAQACMHACCKHMQVLGYMKSFTLYCWTLLLPAASQITIITKMHWVYFCEQDMIDRFEVSFTIPDSGLHDVFTADVHNNVLTVNGHQSKKGEDCKSIAGVSIFFAFVTTYIRNPACWKEGWGMTTEDAHTVL